MKLPLEGQPVLLKLVVLLLIALGSVIIFTTLALLLLEPIYGYSFSEAATILDSLKTPREVSAAKLIQLFSALGLFIIPPFIFVFLSTYQRAKYLNLDKFGPFLIYLIIPALMVAAMPLINYLAELNKALQFPESMAWLEEWMQDKELAAERATKAFLHVESIPGLLFNIFLIAIIPAIGEELLFRGTVQKLFWEGTASKHLAIWLAAILFSAMHFQFYGFLPRMLMGALFGYMLVWSGSLWAPIFAHFVNNAMAVVVSFLVLKGELPADVEHVGEGEGQGIQVVSSLAMVVIMLVFYHYVCKGQKIQGLKE